MKNNGISSSYNTEIESGFYVLRFKNDTERIIRKKHPVNQDVIQFHFCLKGQTNFSFNKMKELVGKVLDANLPKFAQQVDLKLPEINSNVKLPKLS